MGKEAMESILTLEHVSASYNNVLVLDDVSFTVQPHLVTAIIGSSGCGKSTLLSCINRTIELTDGASWSGRVLLKGAGITQQQADWVREQIGLVLQNPAPFPFSIERNMTYALRYQGIRDKKCLDEQVRHYLSQVGLLDEIDGDLKRSALELSGGQQQRLCIARALTVCPQVLMLDEPCSALDVASTHIIENIITQLKKTTTVLLVTHNLAQAQRIADRVVCLAEGKLVKEGAAEHFFDENGPDHDLLRELYR